ncbi:MAG TPA: hypothetical protein VL359_16785 [bacterium]|nr:hypothetical protein [bacterium]
MKPETTSKIKSSLWGAVAGAIIAMVIGFTWGGWTTSGTTTKLAEDAVLKSEATICAAQFMRQPNHVAKLAALEKVESWKRGDIISAGGWDKMPGQAQASPDVAQACNDRLQGVDKL